MKIRIATRKSPLAIWQSQFVKNALLKTDPTLEISFIELTTKGDREQTTALTDIGGKSLFVKELQQAMLNNEADIAVHSIKDMSVQDSPGLTLAAICERDDPRDAFLSTKYASIKALPENAVVGTASPRRTSLLKSIRPDLQTKLLRGNVGTRLNKLDDGQYDAIILATAGLKRLGLDNRITDYLNPSVFIPAIGQAAIGIECCDNNKVLLALISQLNHTDTAQCVLAERAVNKVLNGDCHTPLAAYAIIDGDKLKLHSMVGSLDGSQKIESRLDGSPNEAVEIGEKVGNDLLEKGAGTLLNKSK